MAPEERIAALEARIAVLEAGPRIQTLYLVPKDQKDVPDPRVDVSERIVSGHWDAEEAKKVCADLGRPSIWALQVIVANGDICIVHTSKFPAELVTRKMKLV